MTRDIDKDLNRLENKAVEQTSYVAMKREIQYAFSKPDSDYHVLSADDVIARNRRWIIKT